MFIILRKTITNSRTPFGLSRSMNLKKRNRLKLIFVFVYVDFFLLFQNKMDKTDDNG